MMSGTATCREGKRRCMASVAADDAGIDDAFTLRLVAVMLVASCTPKAEAYAALLFEIANNQMRGSNIVSLSTVK